MFLIFITPLYSKTEQNYPLSDIVETPEARVAKGFFTSIAWYFNFPHMGTIGGGSEGIRKSYQFFSKEYKAKVSEDEYFKSFENLGEFRVLQLYTASSEKSSNTEKGIFFELTLVEGEEENKRNLFLGGSSPTGFGGSEKCLYGFMYLIPEKEELKINKIIYHMEFPLGGGHSVGRLDPIEAATNAVRDDFSNDEIGSLKINTQYIYPDHLIYVTLANGKGKQKVVKLAFPTKAGDDGWICILKSDNNSDLKINDHVLLGKKLFLNKKFDQAISEYQKAINENSNDFQAYELKGYTYYRAGNYLKAIDSLEKSVELNHAHLMGYYNLALAYWANGQRDKALEEIKRLLIFDKSYKEKIKEDPQFKEFQSSKNFVALLNKP
jgi:tetratricopeptide (TPR) repeat protein